MQQLQLNSTLQGGKYIIKKVLGQGGFGITYLAEHDLLGTKVAIKEFFMKDFCTREETTSHVSVVTESGREQVVRFREKFLKEARNIARLRHPNIVRISDVFEENGTAYYVMDYCEGGSLSELLKLHPNGISEPLALKYVRQVASALEQVHAMKINHLDIKPANILLDAQGNAVLIDFGLAKQYDVTTGNQTSTTPVGISHGYAPMEQYKQGGVSEFSPATDIYSLGATLFKLITGQTPPEAQVLLEEELPAFAATQNVTTAIRKAMQVRRLDRPQSIKEWMNLLGESSTSNTCSSTNETSTPKQEVEDESTCIENGVWQEEEASRQQELKAKAEREAKAAEEANVDIVVPEPKPASKPKPQPKPARQLGWKRIIAGVAAAAIIISVAIWQYGRNEPSDINYNDSVATNPIDSEDSSPRPTTGTLVPITVNGVTFNMIKVDGGTFTMGATSEMTNPDNEEKPTHKVTLSSYYIGETEVTQALWTAVMGDNPSWFTGDNLPVEQVSWEDCQTFIRKLNGLTGKSFRLPTEAEWEFAARGGKRSNLTEYSGGSMIDDVAWDMGNSGRKTHSVKTKKPNELGLYDMSGNVYEWCQDWYGSYSSSAQTNPTGPDSGSHRVFRGGSWYWGAWFCRSSFRYHDSPGYRNFTLGFRLALSE